MAEHGIAELWFEPCALGGHDAAGVGDGHEVLDARGEHGEGAGVFAAVHKFFEFRRAADAADEVDAFAGARIIDAEDGREHLLLQDGAIEAFDRIFGGGELGLEVQRVPLRAAFTIAASSSEYRASEKPSPFKRPSRWVRSSSGIMHFSALGNTLKQGVTPRAPVLPKT